MLCALLTLGDALAAPDPRAVRVERTVPGRLLLGQSATAQLRLRNTGSRTLRGRVRDAWQPTAGAPADHPRISIPPGESRVVTIPILPRRRGELTSRFVMIRSDGPLRIAGRQLRVDSVGAVRVLPPFTARRHLPSRLARLRELDGNTSVQVRGQGTEFDSLREYVRGDDVRSIDWRATARASTTMLRTWRPERDRHVVIVIDTGRTAAARVGDGVRMDAAMEAALLLAALATRAGDHTHLLMFDRVTRARVTRVDGPSLLPTLVDAMAPVEPAAHRHRLGCRLRTGAGAHVAAVAGRAADRAGCRRGGARIPRVAARVWHGAPTCWWERSPTNPSRVRTAPTPPTCTALPRRSARAGTRRWSPQPWCERAPRRSPPARRPSTADRGPLPGAEGGRAALIRGNADLPGTSGVTWESPVDALGSWPGPGLGLPY